MLWNRQPQTQRENNRPRRSPTAPHERVPELIEELLRRLGPGAVFGEPVRSDDTTVVPVAEVRVGFGFGSGYGQEPDAERGCGGGGGAGGKVIPRGYLCVTPSGTRYESIVDVTALAVGGVALAAVAMITLGKMLR